MAIILYDLTAGEDRRFSPFCWRTKMALAHKGLAADIRPVTFTQIPGILDGRRKTLPTIEHDGKILSESGAIAAYLDEVFPDEPSLFGDDTQRGLTAFVRNWVEAVVQPGIVTMVVLDIHDHLAAADQAYFRASREARFGRSLEEVQAGREDRLDGFRQSLTPLRRTLANQAFVAGAAPAYADYLVCGAFQWARAISAFRILAADDPIQAWFERCLDLYDGLGRTAPGYD